MHDDDIPPAEAAEFSQAFNLYVRLDEVKATAARLRAAADRTTGLELEANIRQAADAEVEVARIEAALRGEELIEAIPSAAGLPGGLREGDLAREQPIPESQTDEGHRKRRIELVEEEERARLRVRYEWERERQGTVGEADQDSRPELTPAEALKVSCQRDELPAGAPDVAPEAGDYDAELAALFDPVKVETLKAMFPDEKWGRYADKADRNGLKEAARVSRAMFNPYLAARWWLDKQAPVGWKWERCVRVLVNNLPPRSRDSKHLLTGDFD